MDGLKKMRLGDILEVIFKYTGIKWIVKKIWGESCGCDERKEVLNNLFIDRKDE